MVEEEDFEGTAIILNGKKLSSAGGGKLWEELDAAAQPDEQGRGQRRATPYQAWQMKRGRARWTTRTLGQLDPVASERLAAVQGACIESAAGGGQPGVRAE